MVTTEKKYVLLTTLRAYIVVDTELEIFLEDNVYFI